MKKVYTLLFFSLLTLGLWAQGGSWYLGGIMGYSSQNSNANKNPATTMWYFGPEVGTFFNENWSAGLVLGMDGMSQKDDDGDIMKRNLIKPNLYGRRWWSAGDRLGIFAGLDLAFGTGSQSTYDENQEETKTDVSSFDANLNAGVAYALAERWTLLLKFAALGFSSETQKMSGQDDITTTTFGLVADGNVTSNQFIFVGLYWTFAQGN
jgi:hypothetical protein